MRDRLTGLRLAAAGAASIACACSLEPLTIGYVEAGDDVEFNASAGEAGRSWSEQELLAGVLEIEVVGPLIDLVFTPELSSTHRVIIEVRQANQAALPSSVEVAVWDGEGESLVGSVTEEGARRFDTVLGPGWYLHLSCDESVLVELSARIEAP